MDNTETYIKQCEKATEIQMNKRGNWADGDYFTTTFHHKVFLVANNLAFFEGGEGIPIIIHHPYELIFLPRQDQLQKMLQDTLVIKDIRLLAQVFGNFCNPVFITDGRIPITKSEIRKREDAYTKYVRHYDYVGSLTTMEQLWLAAIMDWKYNKRWNGEDWVNE